LSIKNQWSKVSPSSKNDEKLNYRNFIKRLKNFILTRLYPAPEGNEVKSFIKSIRPINAGKELIRLGGDRDGGYLLPNDFNGVKTCFSPGVGNASSFELACVNLGMKVFMADASVKGPVIKDERFEFTRTFIGGKNRGNFMTLEKWVDSSITIEDSDLLLQMDVEGYEYDIIHKTSIKCLKRFRIIVIEFHRIPSLEYPYHFQYITSAFKKLMETHKCVHIHPNNCGKLKSVKGVKVPEAAEFTFYRKDRILKESPVEKLPHPFDRDNIQAFEKVELPEIWYKD
jgi:hypothetical protein